MAMKITATSLTTTFHLRKSLTVTSHLPPLLLCSTGCVVFKGINFQWKAVSKSRTQGCVVFKGINFECKAVSKSRTQGYLDVVQQNDLVQDDVETDKILYPSDEINGYVERIKAMLGSMDDGETTVSAYDTAWVALVQDVHGTGSQQFPSCLEWIVNNQLPDGSWGDPLIFLAHDRIINTLACVIALTYWKVHPNKCQKGVKFLKDNMQKLEDESEEHMLIGFEVVFPSLIEIARKLEIQVPEDSPAMEEIYARRHLKLTKIPKDIMHKVATTLLYSLEGMPDLKWEKLLKLRCQDGSFLFSPSSTAFALMQTKDEKCLEYLTNVVAKFNGGVPTVYPVDLFEHIWVVDRLQRLGISRYFNSQIKDCVGYIYRYWTKDGICWAKNSNVQDIDDTAMGFRVLRMHGYQVSPDVFRQFEKDGKFVCFAGQTKPAITGMFNLFRASQVLFPEEKILDDAKKFSYNYLKEKQSTNKLLDKWIIAKDLPGEVGYALDMPWYASLPRLETRCYLEQYGGEDDVWIGKTLYRMGNVSNNTYLEMAKLDYNNCQAMHQLEWKTMQQWYVGFNIQGFGTSNLRSLLVSYYLAAASIFEPERSKERIAWAKTLTLLDTISSFFVSLQLSNKHKIAFVDEFINTPTTSLIGHAKYEKAWHGVMVALQGTLHELALDAPMAHSRNIHSQLHHAWQMWLTRWQQGGDVAEGQAELIIQTINLTAGRWVSMELKAHPQYQRLSAVTNNLCHEISHFRNSKENRTTRFNNMTTNTTIESKMQELVQLVLNDSLDDLDHDLKHTFLTVAKTFYYKAYCDPEMINAHIFKVLFESVI